jgi:hypothetical protein
MPRFRRPHGKLWGALLAIGILILAPPLVRASQRLGRGAFVRQTLRFSTSLERSRGIDMSPPLAEVDRRPSLTAPAIGTPRWYRHEWVLADSVHIVSPDPLRGPPFFRFR